MKASARAQENYLVAMQLGGVSFDYVKFIRLEVLVLMGSRRCRTVAVPARLRLSACA